MAKQRCRSRKRKNKNTIKPHPANPSLGVTAVPRPRLVRGGLLLGLAAILAILVIAGAFGCFKSNDDESSDLALCLKFMRLKNAGNPAADDLLAPKPAIPKEPVSPEEAERLDAQFMLRDNFSIAEVRRAEADDTTDGRRFVLVVKGGVISERFYVKTPAGPEPHGRTIGNPDILVEVQNGQIHGLKAGIHHDPNEKPMSAEREREFLKQLQDAQKQQIEEYRRKSK